jgi:hypothetical protein
MWSRRRIRWSGEHEEDYVEQEEDQVVWREGGRSCGAGEGSDGLESRRRIRWSGEQEEDQVVLRAGGGSDGLESRRRSDGLESRRRIRWSGEQEDQEIW